MKKIKEIKNIEILINIIYLQKETLEQHFKFVCSNKKHYSYLFDKRFCFKYKIEKIIKDLALDNFIKRIETENEIIVYYEKQKVPKNIIRKVMGQIPPCCGCQYCELAEEKDNFIYCPERKKHYVKPGIQRCVAFRMKKEVIT